MINQRLIIPSNSNLIYGSEGSRSSLTNLPLILCLVLAIFFLTSYLNTSHFLVFFFSRYFKTFYFLYNLKS